MNSILAGFWHRIRWAAERRSLAARGISIAKHVSCLNTVLADYVNLAHHAEIANSTVGLRTSIGRYSKVQYAHIGKYCSISWDVTIGALEHSKHALSTHAFPYRKKFGFCEKDAQIFHQTVEIGNDVWIGCGVIMMPGVTIGDGAVIGGGSVVTRDVAPYAVAAGCPARQISQRFSDETIALLLQLRWWDKGDEFIRENLELFSPGMDIEQNPAIMEKIRTLAEDSPSP